MSKQPIKPKGKKLNFYIHKEDISHMRGYFFKNKIAYTLSYYEDKDDVEFFFKNEKTKSIVSEYYHNYIESTPDITNNLK